MTTLHDRTPGGLRARLHGGPSLFGTWVHTVSPELVETIGAVGFDIVLLDMEHGEFGIEAVPQLLRAARAGGCFGLVRMPGPDASLLGRILDAGADAVMVPNVSSADTVRTSVRAGRYPPEGDRGASPAVRAARYTVDSFQALRARALDDIAVCVQVEGPDGIAGLDAMLDEVPDLVFIGTFDLSQHLGVAGQADHPVVVEAMHGIVAKARARDVATGTWAPSPAAAAPWVAAGMALVSVSNSSILFTGACRDLIAELRELPTGS